jgi:hypothetical protein
VDVDAFLTRILAAPSEFYRRRGLGGPFDRLRLTRRDDLVQDQLANLPHGTRRAAGAGAPVRTGVTGTGDSLLVLTWSAAELARERAAGVRLLGRLGVTAGMRVANTLPGALATPGALLLGDVVEELGGLDVPLGPIAGEAAARQAWELVDRVEPDVLVLDAASGPELLAAAPSRARPWWRGIVWLVSEAPAPPPAAGFAGWRRAWLAVPEATSFVASTCASSRFHVDEGVVAEVVDEVSGDPAPEGTLAVTPLGDEVPLLRYASGVRVRAIAEQCSCGKQGATFELLRGPRAPF